MPSGTIAVPLISPLWADSCIAGMSASSKVASAVSPCAAAAVGDGEPGARCHRVGLNDHGLRGVRSGLGPGPGGGVSPLALAEQHDGHHQGAGRQRVQSNVAYVHNPREAPGPAVRTSMVRRARGQLPRMTSAFRLFPQVTRVRTPRAAERAGWAFRVVHTPAGPGTHPATAAARPPS